MKGGHTPIHIQRWAPADLHGDEHWKLLVSRRDYRTMHFYRVFMDHAFMAGGDLPADPAALAAVVHMPPRDVVAALDFCIGKLILRDGARLYQKRVRREVKKELRYRRGQSDLGKKGGRPKGQGTVDRITAQGHLKVDATSPEGHLNVDATDATADAINSRGKPPKSEGKPKGTLLDPKSPPAPSPTPAPAPLPTTAIAPTACDSGRALEHPSGNADAGPPATGGGGTVNGHGPILHDPDDPLQCRVAARVRVLADLVAAAEDRPVTRDDLLEVLKAVSATSNGVSLDDLRGAGNRWLEETLRACDRFEEDHT